MVPVSDRAIYIFSGNWRTAFKPEKNSLQEFHVDEATTVMVPMMTHTGQYHYLNDKVRTFTHLLFLHSIKLGRSWVRARDTSLD